MKKSREDEFWKEKAASDWNIKLYLLFSFVSSYFILSGVCLKNRLRDRFSAQNLDRLFYSIFFRAEFKTRK